MTPRRGVIAGCEFPLDPIETHYASQSSQYILIIAYQSPSESRAVFGLNLILAIKNTE